MNVFICAMVYLHEKNKNIICIHLGKYACNKLILTFRLDKHIEPLMILVNIISRRAGVVLLIVKGDIFKRPVNTIPFRPLILKDVDRYIFVQNCMNAYTLT